MPEIPFMGVAVLAPDAFGRPLQIGRLTEFKPGPPRSVPSLTLPDPNGFVPGRLVGTVSVSKVAFYGEMPKFGGNAKQRRKQRRAWLRAEQARATR